MVNVTIYSIHGSYGKYININLYELNIVKRNDLTAIMVCPSTLGWLVVLNPKSTCPRL